LPLERANRERDVQEAVQKANEALEPLVQAHDRSCVSEPGMADSVV
jgi:hypothetical protein